jgi:glucoamylase
MKNPKKTAKHQGQAPGAPGGAAFWNSGAKQGVGTALTNASPLWFTIGSGVVEELFYPQPDHPRSRDFGFAVADGKDFFSWEKDDTDSQVENLTCGVPAYGISNECRSGHYRLRKEVFSHCQHPTLVQRIFFRCARDHDIQLYTILNLHLGQEACAWLGDYKDQQMLFAQGDGVAVALACSLPWLKRSVGFVGASDGWQDLSRHKRMTWQYDRADRGHVALTAQIDHRRDESGFLLALGFGNDPDAAALNAHAALLDGFDVPLGKYTDGWKHWQKSLMNPDDSRKQSRSVYRASTAVMQTHESKQPPGAFVASLSVPFGEARKGLDTGGYHLVWPRDLFETATGFLAVGDSDHIHDTLAFLEATQEPDGHWPQNMWLDGKPHWTGIQMDETAVNVLLIELAEREGALQQREVHRYWPMVRKAVSYLVCNGPITPEDRWEHDGGYSPFTLGAEVAALLVGADMACRNGHDEIAQYLRETADVWNSNIEAWTYVSGTDLAKKVGVEGYYVRLGEPNGKPGLIPGGNPRDGGGKDVVSPDALALVRFGLRAADDRRILETLKVIDAVLKVDLGYGPGWRRYNGDHYGEQADGRPFEKQHGIGRAWPLLAGERGHYELAGGNVEEARKMLHLMEQSATTTGLIPEQVWDADDIPDKGLFRGRPTTSACPLVWAHAEYCKLTRSIRDGAIFDRPRQTVARYSKGFQSPRMRIWRIDKALTAILTGYALRIEVESPAVVRWTTDAWKQTHESEAVDTGLGIHIVDLPTRTLQAGDEIEFTFHWSEADRWEDKNCVVKVEEK